MQGVIETKTRRFVTCPDCSGEVGSVDHLIEKKTSAGPWYCDDCGHGWTLEFDGVGGVTLAAWREKLVPRVVVIELPPQDKPITLLLKRKCFESFTDENHRYLYDEHTCPTNWMRDVDAIVVDGREDPHGLFRFVRVIDDAEGRELYNGGAEALLASLSAPDAEAN